MRKVLIAVLSFSLNAQQCVAGGHKIRIEVVETSIGPLDMSGVHIPGTPEKKETRCKTVEKDGEKVQECTTVTTPAVPAVNPPEHFVMVYEAKVILPDGSHALLWCSVDLDLPYNGCGEIESATPERTKITMVNDRQKKTGLGTFEAKRNNSEILIYTPKGKVRYQITGSW